MYPPDGLLTLKETKDAVEYAPRISANLNKPGDYLDEFPPVDLCLVTETEEPNMNTSEDEPSSGLNGRLRPRKSHVPSPQGKTKPESKTTLDKPKRTSTPSKVSPNKQDDLSSKSDFSPTPQFLCPYCDKKFASRQTVSKHARRIHYSAPKQDTFISCLFCNHSEADSDIIRHMVDSHPNQYFACLDCHTRFPSTSELAEHKLNVCEKQKVTYRTNSRQKIARGTKKAKKSINTSRKSNFTKHAKDFQEGHGFNGIVISCELKPPQDHDGADIEDNITTNLILPPSKNLGGNAVLEKNAVIVLDDIQWNKRIPPNFAFHNTDPDQILSRLGVVHRSPRTGESTRKDWFKALDDATQKFERCFDTKFYSKVASNVQENLSKFLDGSFNFNPDPDSTIKTRKTKNNVVINTAEGFPILLASEQYSRSVFDSYLPRAIAPKHKWKWDNLENDRSLMTAAEILKRDSHTNNCIITLVSSLDIWTQLSMRRKFEDKFNLHPVEKKTEKQNIISKELKEILESREIPTSTQIVKRCASKPAPRHGELAFPAALGLVPAAPTYEACPAVLSGEWVRPRCLVCCACGEQSTDSKGLTAHIATRHPNASVQCYEIVGEPLLNADILKHLYVPPSQVCNRTRPPRGFRECTKCNKSITLDDLHQHMLECAGDTPAVRRRQARQRPFGVRRRRPRMPDNTIRKKMRKDIRSRQRRQKTHIGPRPRIRTEVGDAETIRKMLADLPAKRHRVLVNPLNLMQRPRRKLDMQRSKHDMQRSKHDMQRNKHDTQRSKLEMKRTKLDIQRSKLLMKKRSTEEVKNRKQLIINKKTSDNKDVVSDDPNETMSSLEDDEDNKPLKPKIKPTCKKTLRRREPLKRQAVVMSTAKRKSLRAAKRKVENADKTDASISTEIQDSTLEKPQKIDLKKAAYNTREHAANRGTSNNRDDERPGSSGTNGTANNFCAPTQSVPLKHSIARLTANSETHDKSVQFHHSFLVQQECNNTNQHVPTEQRTLFENEAVVSKLDKPPLNFCQRGFLDIQSLQKNKANKPRKGLNDCIAMLKNKLVDPVPCTATGYGYVSVQCGSDEPIDDEVRTVAEPTIIEDLTVNVEETSQPHKNVGLKPQVRQETTKKNMQNPEETLHLQEKGCVPQYREVTPKTIKQLSENMQIQEKTNLLPYRQEAMKQSMEHLQLQKNIDPVPQYQHKIKQSVEDSQIHENFVPQETFEKVKQSSESLQSTEKVHLTPQYRQEPSRNEKHSSESSHFQEKVNMIPHYRQESFRNAKQNLESSHPQEKNNSLHQYRHESNQKLKHSSEISQFQDKLHLLHRHEISQNIKQYPEFSQLPENLSVMDHYRTEANQSLLQNPETSQQPEHSNCALRRYDAIHKLKQNPEFIRFQENLALMPQYQQEIAQKGMLCAESLHLQEKIYLEPQYPPEKAPVHIDCEVAKSNCKEVSPNIRSRRDSGYNQESPQNRSRRNSGHSQVSPQMQSPYDPAHCQVSPQNRSRRNSGHSQVSPQMRSPYEPGLSQVSPQDRSRRNSGHSQVSPQMRSPYDPGLSQISPQNRSRRNSGHSQVSPQIQSRRDSSHSQVSSQLQSRCDSGHSQMSSPIQTRRESDHTQASLQIRSRRESGYSQVSSHDSGHSEVSPQNRSPHDASHNQASPLNSSPHDSVKSQVSPQFRSPQDSGYSQVSPQNLSPLDSGQNQISAQFRSHHHSGHSQVSSQIRSRHDSGHSLTPETIKELGKRRSTEVYNESDTTKKETQEIKPNWQTPLDVHPAKSGTMFPTHKHSNSYADTLISRNNPDKVLENNVSAQHLNIYAESRLREIPANIPPAHATIVESIMSAPLDLSSKVVNHTHLPHVDSYDNYGTLDLSNKKSDRSSTQDLSVEEDIIVDLSVKPSYSRTSSMTLDLCVKPGTSKSADSLGADILDSYPTDLSVRGKETCSSIKPPESAVVIQDLSAPLQSSTVTPSSENICPTDIPEMADDSNHPKTKLVLEIQESNADSKDPTSSMYKDETVTLGDLTHKVCAKQQTKNIETSNIAQSLSESNGIPAINATKTQTKTIRSTSLDLDKSAMKQYIHEPTLAIPQHKTRADVPVSETVVEDSATEPIIMPSSVSKDLNFLKISASSYEIPTTISSSVSPLTGAVTIHPTAGRVLVTSVSKTESTTPVYTLANACISVTKIESSNASVLTNTLLSIPGSTIASTTPVYTLTGTTINTANNELVNGPAKSQTNPHKSLTHPYDVFVGPDTGIGNVTKSIQKEGTKKDVGIDQDPETAKKIAMLPKELVDILGNMPVDHRNQLLNVLPQYVSTTLANCPSYTETNETIKETLVTMPKRSTSPTGKLSSDKITFEQTHSISFNVVTSTSNQDISAHKFQSVNDNTQSQKCLIEETVVKETQTNVPKHTVVEGKVINTKDLSNTQPRIIDLTEDDNILPASKVVEVSHLITIPQKDLSISEETGMLNKQKKNNDKTASLRAVRIKAPSLRQKEKLNSDSVVHVTAQSVYNAEIQKTENYSIQCNEKTTIDTRHAAKKLPVDKTEDAIKTPENLLTLTADLVNDEVKSADTGATNIKSSVSSPSITDCTHPTKKLEDGCDGSQNIKNASDANIDDVNKEYKTTNESSDYDKNLTLVKNVDNNNLSDNAPMQESNCANVDEEDSEDDIILAAIVKQKQQSNVPRNKLSIKKSKKAKKSRKNLPKETTPAIVAEKASIVEPMDNLIKKDSKMHPYISVNVLDSERELKSKSKVDQNTNAVREKQSQGDVKSGNQSTKPKLANNKADSCSQDHHVAEFVEYGKETESILTKFSNNTKIGDKSPDSTDSTYAFSSTKSQDDSIARPLEDSKHMDKNRKILSSDVNSRNIIELEKPKDESQITIAGTESKLVDQNKTTISGNQLSQSCDTESDSVQSYQKQSKDINKKDIEFKSEINKNTKTDRSKKYSNEFSKDDSIHQIQDLEINIDAPLRRSRRGKSLFLDDNLLAETLNMDSTIDQKGPLTKKQLIFSKLLLDEEKLTKSLISNPEEVTSIADSIETPCIVQSDIVAKASKTDMKDVSTEKNKSVKRKKSPQLKRKSKKKKSGDDFKISDEDTLIDKPESDIKTTPEKSSEVISTTADPISTVEIVENNTCIEKVSKETDSNVAPTNSDTFSDKFSDNVENVDSTTSDKNNYHPESYNTNSNQSKTTCILEKRKISKIPSNSDIDQISKPKKTKFNKNKETESSEVLENELKSTNSNITDNELSTKLENVITTCYNVPVASRRTRSKSVVVKSSNAELYDPYNIDLDDMIQKPEPLRKIKSKEVKIKRKSICKQAEIELTEENELKTEQKSTDTDSVQQNTKENKSELSPFYLHSKAESNEHVLKLNELTDSEKEVKPKKSIDTIAGQQDVKLNKLDSQASACMDITLKDTVSDSDESSKSDVPLKKYVEEKVKKLAAKSKALAPKVDNSDVQHSKQKNNKQITSGCKKKLRTPTVSKDSVGGDLSNETEEQIRSEQFMESFGFFSERKPRKSNLLATKKISETFHIIANEGEDYCRSKERSSKKSVQSEAKKSDNAHPILSKKSSKRGRKKKEKEEEEEGIRIVFCHVCRKEFHRPDNLMRHQMTLLHVAKLSEVELNEKSFVIREEPNYLIAFKQNIDRFRNIAAKAAAKQKRNSRARIVLPDLEDILADVEKSIRGHRKAQPPPGNLSTDQLLFLDCCELLKESRHCGLYALPGLPALAEPPVMPALRAFPALRAMPALRAFPTLRVTPALPSTSKLNSLQPPCTSSTPSGSTIPCFVRAARESASNLDNTKQPAGKIITKSDEVDSVTAKSILESEEIRSLENDLIIGFKEAANEKNARKAEYYATMTIHPHEIASEIFSKSRYNLQRMKAAQSQSPSGASVAEEDLNKTKKLPEYKEKMYPDVIEDIDMFEDKFDKIKRKCRSQAAAAKQVQSVTEPSSGHKGRKKTEKKKGKKSSKKNYQNTVLTKGALKGFDGIKVSIPTSDINMSAIVPPHEGPQRKKKKASSKKKREKRDSETSGRHDNEHRLKDSISQKKVDVYEFMDNEDAELFEFRPSTLMERFKSFNKEAPSTSKRDAIADEPDNSSESASDGDDFVYMSDDYVCSDDETENSSLSCELGNIKIDTKKSTSLKRKDVVEKNAVMGKIFKLNAVRTEKKIVKSKETVKPKANLDQLFDSLLEEEPNSSMLNNDSKSPKHDEIQSPSQQNSSPKYERSSPDEGHKQQKSSTKDECDSLDEGSKQQKSFPKDECNSLDEGHKPQKGSPKYESNSLIEGRRLQKFSSRNERNSLDEGRKQQKSSPKHEHSSLDEGRRARRKSTSPDRPNATKSSLSSKTLESEHELSSNKYDVPKRFKYGPSTSKQDFDKYGPSTSAAYDMMSFVNLGGTSPKKNGSSPSKKHDISPKHRISPILVGPNSESKQNQAKKPSLDNLLEAENSAEFDEDTGVARHRARRKCTVGKQNVLAETWSSESEPDGLPPRPTSAESVVAGAGRKKKGRKRDGQQAIGRRGKVTFNKKQDIESRVTSNKWNTPGSSATGLSIAGGEKDGADSSGGGGAQETCPPPAPSTSSASGSGGDAAKARSRPAAYYWSSEGDDEQEQQQQQHGWIVGNSHKRLVTMLAHAKGRKRNNDDKHHLVE